MLLVFDFMKVERTNTGNSPVSDSVSKNIYFPVSIGRPVAELLHCLLLPHFIISRLLKLLQLHTNPSTVAIGMPFGMRGHCADNSSSPITFSNRDVIRQSLQILIKMS